MRCVRNDEVMILSVTGCRSVNSSYYMGELRGESSENECFGVALSRCECENCPYNMMFLRSESTNKNGVK